jgi:type IV secretion system protein VirD4
MTDDDSFRAGASILGALALADLETGLALEAGGWHGPLTDGLAALISGATVPHPAVSSVAGGCLALATGVLGAAGLEGWARWAARRESPGTGSAAVPAGLVVTSLGTGRVVLGVPVDGRPQSRMMRAAAHERGKAPRVRLVALPPEDSLVIVGSTGSGKTSGVAAPLVRDWGAQPAVVMSANTDLLRQTIEERRKIGEVAVYDPTGVSAEECVGWSPLARAGTWKGAAESARGLARLSGTAGSGGDRHWEITAKQLLAPLMHAAAVCGLGMAEVMRWAQYRDAETPSWFLAAHEADVPTCDVLCWRRVSRDEDAAEHERDAAAKSLRELGRPGGKDARRAWDGLYSYVADRNGKHAESAWATVATVLDAFDDDGVLDAADRPDSVSADWLLAGPRTLYIVGAPSDQERLAPAFQGLIDEVLRDAEKVGVRRGRTADGAARLLVLHDESANIAPIPELARRASTARGYGITLVSIFQGFPQIESAYGRDAGTVFAQHAARLLLPGASDVDTLRAFSGPEGDGQVTTSSSTSSVDGRASSTEGQQWRPTLEVRELRRMPRWTGLLLYGNLPAVRVRLRPPVGVTV